MIKPILHSSLHAVQSRLFLSRQIIFEKKKCILASNRCMDRIKSILNLDVRILHRHLVDYPAVQWPLYVDYSHSESSPKNIIKPQISLPFFRMRCQTCLPLSSHLVENNQTMHFPTTCLTSSHDLMRKDSFPTPKTHPACFFRSAEETSSQVPWWQEAVQREEGLQLFIALVNMKPTAPILLLLLLVLVQADFADGSLTSQSVKVYRQMVYEQTQQRIDRLNAAFGDTYTSVHNQFSYLTPDEFRSKYMGGALSPPGSPMRVFANDIPRDENAGKIYRDGPHMNAQALINHILPNNGVFSIDYSGPSYNLVTSVKNQGSCGSCWAFASIAEIESLFLYRHKMMLDLSEQQMVDCMHAVDNNTDGCNGGMMDSVEFYAAQYYLVEEKYYPYTEKDQTCKQSVINLRGAFKINGYNYISGCTQMASTLLATRPFAVCGVVDDQWQNYGSGVVTSCNVGTPGGHCILLVGVVSDGTQNQNTNYFKYKNQWGYNWGINGYIHLYRDYKNQTGMCGFCSGVMSY